MNNPTKIVNELIYDYNLNIEEAIDIEDLISKMNIRLVSTELEEGILGASKVEVSDVLYFFDICFIIYCVYLYISLRSIYICKLLSLYLQEQRSGRVPVQWK